MPEPKIPGMKIWPEPSHDLLVQFEGEPERIITVEQQRIAIKHLYAKTAHIMQHLEEPKPRRWLVEEHLSEMATWQGKLDHESRPVYVRIVREVKPITRHEISAATAKTMNRYTGGPFNQFWVLLMLRELGIEVED